LAVATVIPGTIGSPFDTDDLALLPAGVPAAIPVAPI